MLAAREVESASEARKQTDSLIDKVLGKPRAKKPASRGTAIIYGPTRKRCEAEAERLQKAGYGADAYHAGLPATERERVQVGVHEWRAPDRGRHQCVRHGGRSLRRTRRGPPGAAGLDRGVLSGGRARRARRRDRARADAELAEGHRAAPPADRGGRRGPRSRPDSGGAQVEHVPGALALGRGRHLPSHGDLALLRHRESARRVRPLRRVQRALGGHHARRTR